jgi:hypothetical protein
LRLFTLVAMFLLSGSSTTPQSSGSLHLGTELLTCFAICFQER